MFEILYPDNSVAAGARLPDRSHWRRMEKAGGQDQVPESKGHKEF